MKRVVVALVVLALLLVSGVVTVLAALGSDEEPEPEQQPAASLAARAGIDGASLARTGPLLRPGRDVGAVP